MYFSSFQSPIGSIEIKATDEALISILFADKENDSLIEKNKIIIECEKQLSEYFTGNRKDFNLKFELKGTIFQLKVWKQLEEIPFGKTCTYLDVAKSIDNTKSIRAVGKANGSNKLAILLPCHRVIASDGKLTGYAGGLWRKQWLLNHEQKFAHGIQTLF